MLLLGVALLFGQTLAQSVNSAVFAKGPGKHRLLVLDGNVVKWGKPKHGVGATVTYALQQFGNCIALHVTAAGSTASTP